MLRAAVMVFVLVVAHLICPAPAYAAPTDELPLRMQYTAHPGCPDALSFFWHVRARTQRVRLANPGELATLVSVNIVEEGTESVGTLELPAPGSQPFQRQVRAVSCEEVVLALSLVLALQYDPDAVQTFPSVPPATPPNPKPVAAPAPVPVSPPVEPAEENVRWRAAFGVHGLFVGGMVASALEPAFDAFLEVGRFAGLFSPTLDASFVVVPKESGISSVDPTARFGYLGGRLTLCPIRIEPAKSLDVAPCIGADIGRLSASTELTVPENVAPKPWAAGLLLGRLRWNFFDRFFGETIAGFGVTLESPRDRFTVEKGHGSQEKVFEVPPVVSDFGIGLGAYFP